MTTAASRGLLFLVATTIFVARFALAQEPAPQGTGLGATAPLPTPPELFTGPPEVDGPVVVRASFYLGDINEIDDQAEAFEFEGVLTLKWKDPRQAFDPQTLGVGERVYAGDYQISEILAAWMPRVVLANESGFYDKPGSTLRIRPNGEVTLTETINAVAEADLNLRRYPYDSQTLHAVFEVLGFDADEVRFEIDPSVTSDAVGRVRTPQWTLVSVDAFVQDRPASYAGTTGVASSFVVRINVDRESFFMVRLVILPLILIVMLSWSVFWMDRSSVADRINVSFIGILTAVAYQIVVSEIWPQISYFTLMSGFLNLSLIIMGTTVVINLVVGKLDQSGRSELGDLVDRRCRWIFPATYFGLIGIMVVVAFVFF